MKKLIILLVGSFLSANSIVIYNNNLSFVSEDKNLSRKGNFLYINNLSFNIINSSINISSKDVNISSYELLKPLSFDKKLLKLNLNKKVDFIINKENKSGTLVQINPRVIIKSEDKYYLINNLNSIIFKKIPKHYKKKPYLKVKVQSSAENLNVNLKYLIKNISWSSNYILNLNENSLDLKAFINVDNKSSKSFKNYNIAFVAGKLNRVNRYEEDLYRVSAAPIMVKSARRVVSTPKKIDSYYIYNLPYKDSIRENSSKEFLLFEAKDIKYKNYYIAKSKYLRAGEQKLSFIKTIEFKNSKKSHLSRVLPEGIVRIYSKDIYLGEDYIKNTPVNNSVKLKIGVEFDLSGKSRVLEYEESKNYQKSILEYSIKNSSNKEKLVKIREYIPNYRTKTEIKYETTCKNRCSVKKLTAFLREYEIKLKAKEEYKFKRTYEIFYQ